MNKLLKSDYIYELALVVVTLIWGGGFPMTKMALDSGMSSGMVMMIRFLISAIVLLVAFSKQLKSFTKDELRIGIMTGVFLFGGFYTQTLGMKYTTPSNNAFFTATNVLMVPFIAWMLLKKKPKNKFFVAAFICFVGMIFLSFKPVGGFKLNGGDILTIICAVFFACHISYVGCRADNISTAKLTFLQMATAALLSVIFFLIFDVRSVNIVKPVSGIASTLYLGLFSTCLAFFLQMKAQTKIPTSKASIILSMESLFGCIFSVILGYDSVSLNMAIGGLLILSSVIMLEIKPQNQKSDICESR